jgi:RNase P/RNase MRP subunit p29
MKGTIINETKNTFTIDCEGHEKKMLKSGTTFLIDNKKIKGDAILKRPEERIKK